MRFPFRSFCWLGVGAALLASVVVHANPTFDSAVISRHARAHLTYLADDALEGRGAGTRGHALAAKYVAAQFARIGLEPGADQGSYEQPVKLLEATNLHDAGRFVIHAKGGDVALTPVTDMMTWITLGETEAEITAPAVFVGFGIEAPEMKHDDFAGVDLKGKIAVIFYGAPSSFPGEQRAHYSNSDQKRARLVKAGAVGVITVFTPRDEAHYPWIFITAIMRFPGMRLVDGSGKLIDSFPQLRVNSTLSRTGFARLLADSGHTMEEAFATAATGAFQSFPLNLSLTLGSKATTKPAESMNVLGWLPGSDPALAREPIVVTCHLDHLGIAAAVNGDNIYNGAMDNGMGVSLMLAVAEELAAGPKLRRPILFAAVTAEEKGLLGATYLARNPPSRVTKFAANVNIDMPLFIAEASDLIAYGAEHSTLGETLQVVAPRHHMTVTPDPIPDEVIFVRSDQYPFVKQGVPAIYLDTGIKPVDAAVDLAALNAKFRKERYHKPSDDLGQPVNWPAVGKYGALMADLTQAVADDARPPTWLPGDFFGELFAPKK
jgi:hypothetical protein